jgi:hypothetical protein
MKTLLNVFWMLLFLTTTSPATGQENPFRPPKGSPPADLIMGRHATVDLHTSTVEGELLSVTPDSLWVLTEGEVAGLALSEVEDVDVRMHSFGARRMTAWTVIAGLGSAVALTLACNSVDGATNNCGGVFASWTLGWALIGGIAGAALSSTSHRSLPPVPGALRPYTRYPQGTPWKWESDPGPYRPGGR